MPARGISGAGGGFQPRPTERFKELEVTAKRQLGMGLVERAKAKGLFSGKRVSWLSLVKGAKGFKEKVRVACQLMKKGVRSTVTEMFQEVQKQKSDTATQKASKSVSSFMVQAYAQGETGESLEKMSEAMSAAKKEKMGLQPEGAGRLDFQTELKLRFIRKDTFVLSLHPDVKQEFKSQFPKETGIPDMPMDELRDAFKSHIQSQTETILDSLKELSGGETEPLTNLRAKYSDDSGSLDLQKLGQNWGDFKADVDKLLEAKLETLARDSGFEVGDDTIETFMKDEGQAGKKALEILRGERDPGSIAKGASKEDAVKIVLTDYFGGLAKTAERNDEILKMAKEVNINLQFKPKTDAEGAITKSYTLDQSLKKFFDSNSGKQAMYLLKGERTPEQVVTSLNIDAEGPIDEAFALKQCIELYVKTDGEKLESSEG